jgi:hypothetical protein
MLAGTEEELAKLGENISDVERRPEAVLHTIELQHGLNPGTQSYRLSRTPKKPNCALDDKLRCILRNIATH